MAKKTFLLPPNSQEREYTRLLLGLSKSFQTDVNNLLIPKIGSIKASFEREIKSDTWEDEILSIFYELMRAASFKVAAKRQSVQKIEQAIEKFNDKQFLQVVMANKGGSLGVNPFRSEPYLVPLSNAWMTDNMALIKSLPVKMNEELEGILRRGVMNGNSVNSIQKEIKARYGVTDARARLIAQDQTLKYHSMLSEYRLKSVGVEKYTWKTVGDSRVRPEHVARNGNVYSWDKPPAGGNHPGIEIRCLPFDSNIEVAHGCDRIWRRTNASELTKIITQSGKSVNATMNHPVLTNRGWVAIQDVSVGDYLFNTSNKRFHGIESDIQASPVKIGEIFDSISSYVGFYSSATAGDSSRFEFNGDAANCNVDTVNINGFLPSKISADRFELIANLFFTMADANISDAILNADRPLYLSASRLWYSSDSVIRGLCKFLLLVNRKGCHSDKVCLTSVSNILSDCDKIIGYNASAASVLFGQSQDAFTASVLCNNLINRQALFIVSHLSKLRNDKASGADELGESVRANTKGIGNALDGYCTIGFIENTDRVIDKFIGEFSAHVYNLQTVNNWYSTDSLIIHNCRCRAEPIFD